MTHHRRILILLLGCLTVSVHAREFDAEITEARARLSWLNKRIVQNLTSNLDADRSEAKMLESRLELLKTRQRVRQSVYEAPSLEAPVAEASLARARATSPRFARPAGFAALNAEPVLTEAVRLVNDRVDQSIDDSVRAGACPTKLLRDSRKLEIALSTYSLGERDKVAAACQKAGTPFAFAATIDRVRSDRSVGWSQTRCLSNGRIVIVHQNATTSTIDFTAPDALGEISARSSKHESDQGSSIKVVKESGGDRFVLTDKAGEVLYNYPWRKGLAALECARGECEQTTPSDQIKIVPAVDLGKASTKTFDGDVGKIGSTLYQLRGVVGLLNHSPSSFAETCTALGGKLPPDAMAWPKDAKAYRSRDDSPIRFEAARSST